MKQEGTLMKIKKLVLVLMALSVMMFPLLAISAGVNLPRTGQTSCYDDYGNKIPYRYILYGLRKIVKGPFKLTGPVRSGFQFPKNCR